MKFEMELHPNFVSEIVVKQLQEMYDHTKYHWFDTDPEEARAAIAVVLDYFMPPSDYAQWRIDNDFDRNLAEEVVEGFDQLEKEREWVGLTEYDIQTIEGNTRVDDFWATKRTWNKRFAEAIQDTLKRKNTVAL